MRLRGDPFARAEASRSLRSFRFLGSAMQVCASRWARSTIKWLTVGARVGTDLPGFTSWLSLRSFPPTTRHVGITRPVVTHHVFIRETQRRIVYALTIL